MKTILLKKNSIATKMVFSIHYNELRVCACRIGSTRNEYPPLWFQNTGFYRRRAYNLDQWLVNKWELHLAWCTANYSPLGRGLADSPL